MDDEWRLREAESLRHPIDISCLKSVYVVFAHYSSGLVMEGDKDSSNEETKAQESNKVHDAATAKEVDAVEATAEKAADQGVSYENWRVILNCIAAIIM